MSDHPFHAGSSWELDIIELRGELNETTAAVESLEIQNKQLRAEVERLTTALEEYACTGSEKPCGCYLLLSNEKELKAENKQLRVLLERWLTLTAWSGSLLGEETRRALANTATS